MWSPLNVKERRNMADLKAYNDALKYCIGNIEKRKYIPLTTRLHLYALKSMQMNVENESLNKEIRLAKEKK